MLTGSATLDAESVNAVTKTDTGAAGGKISPIPPKAEVPTGKAVGTEGNDEIWANVGATREVLWGLGGDDELHALAVLDEETAHDHLYGGDGNDRIYGGTGKDLGGTTGYASLCGGAGDGLMVGTQALFGGSGSDSLAIGTGSWDAPRAFGDEGDDAIFARGDGIAVYGDNGNDVITVEGDNIVAYGGVGRDSLYGGIGNQTLYGGPGGMEVVHGGSGDDYIHTGNAGNFMYGGSGRDQLYGMEGHDLPYGGDGDDYLGGTFGNAGYDRFYGDAGDDTLDGGADGDELYGGLGNDTPFGGSSSGNSSSVNELYGGEGDDTLICTGLKDRLIGGSGVDRLYGGVAEFGTARDVFVVGEDDAQDRIMDFNYTNGDRIDLSHHLGHLPTIHYVTEGYLRVTEVTLDNQTYASIEVDRDGTAGPGQFERVILARSDDPELLNSQYLWLI